MTTHQWGRPNPANWGLSREIRSYVFLLTCGLLSAVGHAAAQAQRLNTDGIGVTEWEEWAFADKDWWVGVAGNQRRDEFTLGEGVIAIADPDEWDDRGLADENYTYNTQLLSPMLDVSGASALTLEFASSWRPEPTQKASLDVIYDGTPTQLFFWTSDAGSPDFKAEAISEMITLNLPDPAGASEMRIGFNLFDAENDWWWAIDNVELSDAGNSLFFEDFESVPLGPPIDETPSEDPVYSQEAPSGWQVNTDSYIPPVQTRPQPRHPPSITRNIPPQDAPLKLNVDPNSGLAQLVSVTDEPVQLSSYSVVSQAGAIDSEAWEESNLTSRNLDPVDGGDAPGNRWTLINADQFQAFEAFLNVEGGSEIQPGAMLSLGQVYDPSVGGEDLDIDFTAVFTDRFDQLIAQSTDALTTAGTGVFNPVIVEYVELADGDFDGDGLVTGSDFLKWQRDGGTTEELAAWEATFGMNVGIRPAAGHVPEPSQLGLLAGLLGGVSETVRRRRKRA